MQASQPNFRCVECGYKLLQVRIEDAPRSREDALCPHCLGQLPPRDGKFALRYRHAPT